MSVSVIHSHTGFQSVPPSVTLNDLEANHSYSLPSPRDTGDIENVTGSRVTGSNKVSRQWLQQSYELRTR